MLPATRISKKPWTCVPDNSNIVRIQRPSGVVNSFRPKGHEYENFAPFWRNAARASNRVTEHYQQATTMTGTQAGPAQARTRSPQAYQQAFHELPEKRKHELARVVASMTQAQGKLAAQWWLEGQLEAVTDQVGITNPYICTADKNENVTPNRERLVAQAPTTLAVLSPAERAYRTAVTTAEPFTQEQLRYVSPALTPQSCKVFEFLHLYAYSHALNQDQSLKAQQISFFLPAETIPLATGVPKRTVYDALGRLKALGLIDHRGHVVTLEGYGSRCDGTVFAVKLDVLRTGEARVTFEDLKVSDYRDLQDDIDAGRTVYRLAQSETWVDDLRGNVCRLLSWIASKCTQPWDVEASKPRFMTVQASSKLGLEAVLNVTTGPVATRGQRIGAAATAIARALGDQHSLAFWWRFCDAFASLVERGGRDYGPSLVACIQREVAAKQEGFARCPAALLISRLKCSGIYGEIMTA